MSIGSKQQGAVSCAIWNICGHQFSASNIASDQLSRPRILTAMRLPGTASSRRASLNPYLDPTFLNPFGYSPHDSLNPYWHLPMTPVLFSPLMLFFPAPARLRFSVPSPESSVALAPACVGPPLLRPSAPPAYRKQRAPWPSSHETAQPHPKPLTTLLPRPFLFYVMAYPHEAA
ncbi:hypothetical protein SLA2020_276390 [Shorea laevis]